MLYIDIYSKTNYNHLLRIVLISKNKKRKMIVLLTVSLVSEDASPFFLFSWIGFELPFSSPSLSLSSIFILIVNSEEKSNLSVKFQKRGGNGELGMDGGGGSSNSTATASAETSYASSSILSNYPLISALFAFFIAQSTKVVSSWYTSAFLLIQWVYLCFLLKKSLDFMIDCFGILAVRICGYWYLWL